MGLENPTFYIMIIQILRLLPTILPLILKLFSGLSELEKPKVNNEAVTKAQKDAVDEAVKAAKKEVEEQIEATIEKYRPKVREVANKLPTEKELARKKRLEELEAELLKDQKEYEEKNPS